MPHLKLDQSLVDEARSLALHIAEPVIEFMEGPPDTPTIHLGVRRPQQGLHKDESIRYNDTHGCATYPACHVQARLPFCLVPKIPQEASDWETCHVCRAGTPPDL